MKCYYKNSKKIVVKIREQNHFVYCAQEKSNCIKLLEEFHYTDSRHYWNYSKKLNGKLGKQNKPCKMMAEILSQILYSKTNIYKLC
jgi:hypothetical protein